MLNGGLERNYVLSKEKKSKGKYIKLLEKKWAKRHRLYHKLLAA